MSDISGYRRRSAMLQVGEEHSPETSQKSKLCCFHQRRRSSDKDVPMKKKRFSPLWKLKNLFTSGKKKKGKDDVASVGIKSTSMDPLGHSENQLSGKNQMSLSADSVFTTDKPRDPSPDLSRSMEIMPVPKLMNELARKLQVRHPHDDKGSGSRSPRLSSPVDAIIDNGLRDKKMDNYSSEEELEVDFFRRDWASASLLHLADKPKSRGSVEYDLDAIASTTSLNITAAKHKIAVKSRAKVKVRPTGRLKTTVPKSSNVTVLPENSNNSAILDVDAIDIHTSNEEIESTNNLDVNVAESSPRSSGVDIVVSSPRSSGVDVVVSTPRSSGLDVAVSSPRSSGVDIVVSSPRSSGVESDHEEPERKLSFSEKTGLSSGDEEKPEVKVTSETVTLRDKPETSEEKPAENSVVILRRPALSEHDASKRQTIAVATTSEITPFGERKKNRSSLILDSRNWEQLEKPKEKPKEEPKVQTNSEFASVFARFQKQTVSPENKKTLVFGAEKKISSTNSAPVSSKPKDNSPVDIDTSVEVKNVETVVKKPKVLIIEKKNSISSDKPSVNKTNDNVKVAMNTTPAKSSIVKSSSTPPKTDSKSSEETPGVSTKQDPQRIPNRAHSQTVPATTRITDIPQIPDPVKRVNSHDDGVNKENIPSPSSEEDSKKSSSVMKSAAAKPTPQKLQTGGKASWVEIAQKRNATQPQIVEKSPVSVNSNDSELASKRASVHDLMKRFQ